MLRERLKAETGETPSGGDRLPPLTMADEKGEAYGIPDCV